VLWYTFSFFLLEKAFQSVIGKPISLYCILCSGKETSGNQRQTPFESKIFYRIISDVLCAFINDPLFRKLTWDSASHSTLAERGFKGLNLHVCSFVIPFPGSLYHLLIPQRAHSRIEGVCIYVAQLWSQTWTLSDKKHMQYSFDDFRVSTRYILGILASVLVAYQLPLAKGMVAFASCPLLPALTFF